MNEAYIYINKITQFIHGLKYLCIVRGVEEVWKKSSRVAAQFNHLLCGNSQAGFPRIHEFRDCFPVHGRANYST